MDQATIAGGCFWCTEAIFSRLKGVLSVTSGYAGGGMEHPSYEDVSTGDTGHAEAVQIEFDPAVISFEKLLEIFWKTHDPTTVNQQGNDRGPQYRSVIFYHHKEQQKIAEALKEKLDASDSYNDPIVTEIVPLKKFYTAEEYHQKFYDNNKTYGYCQLVIDPKIDTLLAEFKDFVKPEYLASGLNTLN